MRQNQRLRTNHVRSFPSFLPGRCCRPQIRADSAVFCIKQNVCKENCKNCWRDRMANRKVTLPMESVATNNLENSSANAEPNQPKPIAEFVARADYPQCTLN